MPADCAAVGDRLPLVAAARALPCCGAAVLACAAVAAVEAAMSAERRIEAWTPIMLNALAASCGCDTDDDARLSAGYDDLRRSVDEITLRVCDLYAAAGRALLDDCVAAAALPLVPMSLRCRRLLCCFEAPDRQHGCVDCRRESS